MEDYIILAAVIAAGVCGIIITKNTFGSDQIHGKLKNRYDTYIESVEKENKKLTGKINQMKKGVSLSKDEFDADNPLGSISELVQQFAPMLPKSVRPFLSDPKLIKFGEKMLAENPEQLKNIISKFVTKGKDGKKDDALPDESNTV
mgnify:CR=1 FL=1|tara:strand:- start:693 stop:1130 length:438 start_codon:yes stop_codon:yes gene_type:complete